MVRADVLQAPKTSLHHLVRNAAAAFPDSPGITYKQETVTYGDLWRRLESFAAGLASAGLQRHDRVAIFLEKRAETVVSIFGASMAGGVAVPVNPLLKPPQVAYILADSGARFLVTSGDRLALLREHLATCKDLQHVIVVGDAAAGPDADGRVTHPWAEFCEAAASADPVRHTDADMAAILYTSGSTGRPKGVVVSHRNLIVGAESVSHYLNNGPDDTILSALPLSFDAGLSQLTTAFNVGAHVILLNYLLAGDVVRLCEKHGVTGITGVPPFWIQVADQKWPSAVAARLRYFANTGGRMPKATLDKLRQHFPAARPYLMYGLTEAFRSTYLDPEQVDRRPDSIGKAIPNAEILVLRPDGSRCQPGEEGELVHRGPLVALGYWNDPEKTRERFKPLRAHGEVLPAETAVFSGDTVVADDEGFLYFVGRKDDMIKTSGYRVSPTEIEEVAYSTRLVRDAVALGIEDAALGQRIVLVAAPQAGVDLDQTALMAAMKKQLPQYMLPASIVEMEAIPTSPNGKFDRVLLRERLKD